jgi:predicted permease
MDTVRRELRLALRSLGRRPAFALTALLTLGLGIGADTTVFSVVNAVLFRPLPYQDPGRLVMVWTAFPAQGNSRFSISPAEFLDYEHQSRSFASMGAWGASGATLTGGDRAERCLAGYATRGLFRTVGARPVLGRLFTPGEDAPGGQMVAVLGHALWASRFGSDSSAVDGSHRLTVDGERLPIVGVLGPDFELPGGTPDFFVPAQLDRAQYAANRSGHNLSALARLAPGTSLPSARSELGGILTRWETEYAGVHPNDPVEHPLLLESLDDALFGSSRLAMLALVGAVGLVLLLAAANVANLMLARGFSRRREMGIRGALGATRAELVRQLMVESLILASLGGVLGLGLGWSGLRLLGTLDAGGAVPVATRMDGRVLLSTLLVTLLAGVVFGVAPALQASGWDLRSSLADAGRGASEGRGPRRTMRALVVAQTGLAVVLLIGSGLLVASLLRLGAVPPGFETAGRFGFSLQLMPNRYPDRESAVAFYDRLTEELGALPGVRRVAVARGLPMQRYVGTEMFTVYGRVLGPDESPPSVDLQFTSPGYFRTMGIPVVEGREFSPRDRMGAPLVALLNETAARAYFPGDSPVGQRIRLLFAEEDWPLVTVAGVVGDVRQRALAQPPRPEIYVPPAQMPTGWASGLLQAPQVVVEAAVPLASLSSPVRELVARLDPDVPVGAMQTMARAVSDTAGRERFLSVVLSVFAILAVIIAGVGLYGVMTFSVQQRRREIAIRLAVGARPGQVLASVARDAMGLAAAGGALGLATAALSAPAMVGLLYQVRPREALVYAASIVLLGVVAGTAALVPARRAAATDPVVSLSAE